MKKWKWIDARAILAIHDEQLAEHGGGAGTRDANLLESALARPVNLGAYESPDVAMLAASYAVGIAKNHPFIDGNKRTAFVAMELFLYLNGHELMADDADCVLTMLGMAAGNIGEVEFAEWIQRHIQQRK